MTFDVEGKITPERLMLLALGRWASFWFDDGGT